MNTPPATAYIPIQASSIKCCFIDIDDNCIADMYPYLLDIFPSVDIFPSANIFPSVDKIQASIKSKTTFFQSLVQIVLYTKSKKKKNRQSSKLLLYFIWQRRRRRTLVSMRH